jgi:HEPN domain-containing protein
MRCEVASRNLKIDPGLQPMRPKLPPSSAFSVMSKSYRDAGDAVLKLIRTESYTGHALFPCVFLYFRSIELALKAVLVANGVLEQEIARKVKHQISALLKRVEEFVQLSELGIRSEDRQLLDRYSQDYSDKWFEYPDKLSTKYPRLEQLRDLAHCVCDKVHTHAKTRESSRR